MHFSSILASAQWLRPCCGGFASMHFSSTLASAHVGMRGRLTSQVLAPWAVQDTTGEVMAIDFSDRDRSALLAVLHEVEGVTNQNLPPNTVLSASRKQFISSSTTVRWNSSLLLFVKATDWLDTVKNALHASASPDGCSSSPLNANGSSKTRCWSKPLVLREHSFL